MISSRALPSCDDQRQTRHFQAWAMGIDIYPKKIRIDSEISIFFSIISRGIDIFLDNLRDIDNYLGLFVEISIEISILFLPPRSTHETTSSICV